MHLPKPTQLLPLFNVLTLFEPYFPSLFSMLLQTLLLWAAWGLTLVSSQNPYPITGVQVENPANGVPMRKNINDLQNAGGPQWYEISQLGRIVLTRCKGPLSSLLRRNV